MKIETICLTGNTVVNQSISISWKYFSKCMRQLSKLYFEPFSAILPCFQVIIVNFAFFAWNPFNLPREVGWYHCNPQNRPKGALFRGYKKSRFFFKKSVKILNWPWRAHFWAHRHLSYHFGNLWPSTWEWLKGNWPKVARSITYWPFFETLFCSRNFLFSTFGILIFLLKSHYFKKLLRILEKNLWNGPQKWVFWEFFFEIMPESKNDQG